MIQKDYDREPGLPAAGRPSAFPRSAWVLSDGKAGDEAQCIGVAEALKLPYDLRRVEPRKPFAWFLPKGPIDPKERETVEGSPIAPPFPDLVIASGRRAAAYLKRVKQASRGRTFTVFLKDPRTGPEAADLIWVPEHDSLRGPNVLVSATSPHRFSAQKLKSLRTSPIPEIDALPAPRIAVLAGGNSRHHRFTGDDISRFAAGLEKWGETQSSGFMITASRRTPEPLVSALKTLANGGRHLFWDGHGTNPLPAYLAKADAIVATADSTNMIGEAAATGKPVHLFMPSGGHRKIDRFLATLADKGVIHPFPGPFTATTYEPIDATPWIAQEILRAYQAKQQEDATEARRGPERAQDRQDKANS
ncbi:mitochondrial fission ELM1 family protein [Roseibium sp. RKSG952]|uniref:mitochondrial fission ELM1 family protein n=1 Tax=Roseibium sp. RKSG952 TaxID=2529384 RepID=UPI0012BC5115|nr:mitochondrial fission ELM1 family protein [Roseibium sp. RKSG952]MTH99588.1 nucleoside-diphosphate sugar epimerase [Roseibium sp. RKSG952]